MSLLPYYLNNSLEAGCDEAGRGCLAGPVMAAAVILPPNFYHPDLNDSKQVSEKKRDELRIFIEKNASYWAVANVDNIEIDSINILNASIKAMQIAVDKLKIIPEHLLIDGNRFHKHKNILHTCIVKGDSKYMSIAAASILAKTHRDDYMKMIDLECPQYFWKENKGYPTKKHVAAILMHGFTNYHRKSFRVKGFQPQFDFLKSC